jgi:hypothetical protein
MPKTTVGLFMDAGVVEDVVREIEALGIPRNEVRAECRVTIWRTRAGLCSERFWGSGALRR